MTANSLPNAHFSVALTREKTFGSLPDSNPPEELMSREGPKASL